jgi:hypothetical protein
MKPSTIFRERHLKAAENLSSALEVVCAISPVVNLTLGENEAANAVLGGL